MGFNVNDTPRNHRSGQRSDALEPLAVSPRQAYLLLGIGNTRLYQLIGDSEVEAYHKGRARRITMRSVDPATLRRLSNTSASPRPPFGTWMAALLGWTPSSRPRRHAVT